MMWLMALLLLLPSLAFAQDMPDIVRVDVNVTFVLPTQSTPVNVSGTAMYQNSGSSPGYISQNFVVTGEGLIDGRQRVGPYAPQTPPCCPTVVWIQAPWTQGAYTTIEMTFEPSADANGPKRTLPPGDYPLSARYEYVAAPVTGHGEFFVYGASGTEHVSIAGLYQGSDDPPYVGAPELAILRSFTKHLGGRQLNAALNPPLQRVTTWGAAMLLGADHEGDRIFLRNAILEVQEWCSGLVTMKWLLVLAAICLAIGRVPWPWAAIMVLAVPLIAIEVNILRVVGIGAGLDVFGVARASMIKDWMGWGATGLGVAQVAGLGAMVRRRR
jgi:exosortase/archaeosortase family protein